MRRTLFIYSFIISLIAALALPPILDSVLQGLNIVETQYELAAVSYTHLRAHET